MMLLLILFDRRLFSSQVGKATPFIFHGAYVFRVGPRKGDDGVSSRYINCGVWFCVLPAAETQMAHD